MFKKRLRLKVLFIIPLLILPVLFDETGYAAKQTKKDKEKSHVMTEAQLQSHLMSFADRFASISGSAWLIYDQQAPPSEERLVVLSHSTNAVSSAFTIAADADPNMALLNMVSMVSLGRIIYEEALLKKYGPRIEPMLELFRKAETDIWGLADRVLTPKQHQDFKAIIMAWHKANPEVIFFPYIRFSDLIDVRGKSMQVKAKGLFSSVENATQEVEEMRLLAERGIYLGTRMPLMLGGFMDFWFSELNQNPEIKKTMDDLHRFSASTERLANVAENLPDQIKDFISEEQGVQVSLKELRRTLETGNELVTSTNALVDRLIVGQLISSEDSSPVEPFNIKDYQATLAEASKTIQLLERLIKAFDQVMLSQGWEQTLPKIVESLDHIGSEGDERIDHAFSLGLVFILIFMVGQFFTLLAYRYASNRIFGWKPKGSPS
jgi:hypothetical protein